MMCVPLIVFWLWPCFSHEENFWGMWEKKGGVTLFLSALKAFFIQFFIDNNKISLGYSVNFMCNFSVLNDK